jgi:hypothetical protein
MEVRRVNQIAGKWLKSLRVRLGLSTRDVQRISQKIATDKQNHEFYLSHNWVTDIENGKFTPGLFKLYSFWTSDWRSEPRQRVSRFAKDASPEQRERRRSGNGFASS